MNSVSNFSTISIIIPSHRNEFLEKAVNSVLNQTFPKDYYEIIVVKDYMNEYLDNFLKSNSIKSFYINDVGFFPKVKVGIENSKGEVLCFLDDDDEFISSKLFYVDDIFSKRRELVYLHNNFTPVDKRNEKVKFRNADYNFNCSCISIRRQILKLENIKNIVAMLDLFYFLSAIESGGEIYITNKKLTKYRVHDSVTNSINSEFEEIKKQRLNFFGKASESLIFFKNNFKNKKALKIITAVETQIYINMYFLNFAQLYSINLRNYLIYAPRPFRKRFKVSVGLVIARLFQVLGFDLRENVIKRQISSNYKYKK